MMAPRRVILIILTVVLQAIALVGFFAAAVIELSA